MTESDVRVVRAATPADLDRINAEILDQLFLPDRVACDSEAGAVDVPFAFAVPEQRELIRGGLIRKRWRVPLREGLLRIRGVIGMSMHDPAGTGMYTLDELSFDATGSQLLLTTAEDLQISMEVTRVDVELELRPDLAGDKVVTFLFGLIESESHRDVRLKTHSRKPPVEDPPPEKP